MRLVRFSSIAFSVLAILVLPGIRADLSTSSNAPFFTTSGVVHGATQNAAALAPNTIATIYGTNLSWNTHAVASSDLNGGALPTSLEGVTVYVNKIQCRLFFVSPGQINFLIPYELVAPSATVLVARDGVAGPFLPGGTVPAVSIQLATTSPGFFQWNGNFAVAEHADGRVISESAPAKAGEVVVLFAAGLGRTVPDSSSGHVESSAATILYASQLKVLLNGAAVPPESIYYAGVTPGFAGLYQVNVRLPAVLPSNPEIRMVIGSQASPSSIQLATQ